MDRAEWAELMASFVNGELDGSQFEQRFLSAFRASRDAPMPYGVDLTFYAVDAFCADPDLRGPDDIDEHQLRAEVSLYLARLDEPRPDLAERNEQNRQSARASGDLPGATKGSGLKGNT